MRVASYVSAARWLVAVMASVVLAFLVAAVTAQHFEAAIASRANDIIANVMPSVRLLSAARGDLRRLESELETQPSARPEQPGRRASAARQDIDEVLAAYLALPFFPQERPIFAHVTENLALLDHDRAAWESSRDPAALATLRSDIALVDKALERAVEFDAAQGQRLGLEIEHIRGQSKGLVMLLNGLSAVLAIVATVLALRQLRRAARERTREQSEREHREAELAAQNEALGDFSGRVAHDILSPLHTAMLSLDIVRQTGQLDPRGAQATERGIAAVHRVHKLVDGLLAFARAGGKPEPDAAAELAPILEDLVDGLAPQAQDRRLTLALAPVPKGAVACSSGVLTSLVLNLVRNAMKHMGDARERRVQVRVIDAQPCWRIEVSDTGPGIPVDQQQRIFQPYVQLERGASGIGLGLATVDRLVRAHGGTVGVRSEPGAGSLFWFELPKARLVEPRDSGAASQSTARTRELSGTQAAN
jgi:signal transduction histidine kinase